MQKINKKIFLDNLPRKNNKIDWKNSVGCKVKFIYNDIEDYIEIIEYIKQSNRSKLKIKYNNDIKLIRPDRLLECKLRPILNSKELNFTIEFKIEIGSIFKDNKRDLTIIDRNKILKKDGHGYNYFQKWYKYKCNKCGYSDGWIEESKLLTIKRGCSCCKGNTVIKGINDVATTHPYLVKYFVNIEDAYTHTYGSTDKTLVKCPDCGFEKEIRISSLYKYGFSCNKCSDGISYPEKIMCNLLDELLINNKQSESFITQFSKTNAKWCNKYRYDFYFKKDNEEYIVETHGMQHYKESGFDRRLEEEQLNDRNKKELALNNGIKPRNYIVIDCRYSELEFIKNNIINSRLSEIFNLNEVDWIKIGQISEKNLVKEVCDYWKLHNNINNEKLKPKNLVSIFKIRYSTIIEYLNKGNKLNWCKYK